MRVINIDGRCKAAPPDERLNVLCHGALDLVVEAVDCPPYDAPGDWSPRYPERYVSLGAPALDCSQIVAYVARGPYAL